MSSAQTTSERDPGRGMTLYSIIVAVLATVLYGALMGLIVAAAGAGRETLMTNDNHT